MSGGIGLHNPDGYPVDGARLEGASVAALAAHPENQTNSLSIVITDSETIASLNARYRRVDSPTDVLAFPAAVLQEGVGEDEAHIGDIMVAHDYVAARAKDLDASLDDILCLLVIHGVLHLLGYDHGTPAGKARMWAAQERALRRARVSPAIVEVYGNIENE